LVIGGNLPAAAAVGEEVNTSITVFDAQGIAYSLALRMTKTAANEWDVIADPDGTPVTVGALEFDAVDGTLTLPASGILTLAAGDSPTGAAIDLTFNSTGIEIVQYGDSTTAEARSQDGNEMGFLRGFDFGTDGSITGRFSNGQTKVLGVIAVATFTNPGGLQRQGESMFTETLNSGGALVARPGEGDGGQLAPGSLEMSNVELAQEFTNLIIAQRGFQANARSIAAIDELLADIVNLKR
jgi:flagellar hook protein FlgE